MPIPAIYVSSSSFKVPYDRTGDLRTTRKLLLLQGVGGQAEVDIVSSEYVAGSGYTTCVVSPASVVATLATIKLGPVYSDRIGQSSNLSGHLHKDRFSGDYIPGATLPDTRSQTTWHGWFVRVADDEADGYTVFNMLGAANQLICMNVAGTDLVPKTLQGVTNRVTVTHAAGTITVTTPQDTHAAATPTFAGLTLSGLTGILEGKGSSAVGHVASATQYQVLQRGASSYLFGLLTNDNIAEAAGIEEDKLDIDYGGSYYSIADIGDVLAGHLNDTDNPHEVTESQLNIDYGDDSFSSISDIGEELATFPIPTSGDNGKVLAVIDGRWALSFYGTLPSL